MKGNNICSSRGCSRSGIWGTINPESRDLSLSVCVFNFLGEKNLNGNMAVDKKKTDVVDIIGISEMLHDAVLLHT